MESPIEPFDFRNLGIFQGGAPQAPPQEQLDLKRGYQLTPEPETRQHIAALAASIQKLKQENTVLAECLRRLTNTDKPAFQELVDAVFREKFPPPSQGIDPDKLLAVVQMMIGQALDAQSERHEEALQALYIRMASQPTPTPAPAPEAPQTPSQPPAQAQAEADSYTPEEEEAREEPAQAFTGRIEAPATPSIEPVGSSRERTRTRRNAAPVIPLTAE